MKVWPQKWKASASPGFTAFATTPPAVAASRPAPTRARKPRREVSPASESSASPIRSRSAISDLPPPGPARRRLGGRQHALELGQVVERPLGEHGAVRIERDRERAARDPQLAPDLGARRPRRRPPPRRRVAGQGCDRRLQPAADAAALRGEDGERQRRSPARARSARSASTRAPSSGPSSGISSAAAGPRRSRSIPTSRASARTATARPRHRSSATAEPEPEPLVGGQAPLRQQREGGEARGQGQVARHRPPADRRARAEAGAGRAGAPAQERPDERRREHGHQRRRRARRPGRCPRRPRPPGRARWRPASAQATQRSRSPSISNVRQRRAAGAGARELQHRRPRQDERQDETGNQPEHAVKLAAARRQECHAARRSADRDHALDRHPGALGDLRPGP